MLPSALAAVESTTTIVTADLVTADRCGTDTAGAWYSLRLMHLRIARQLESDLMAFCGISLMTYDILNRIQGSAVSTRLNDLLDTIPLSPPSLSRHVEKLESDGLLKRQPDPRDRRAAILTVTGKGRETLAAATPVQRAAVTAQLPAHLTVERFGVLTRTTGS